MKIQQFLFKLLRKQNVTDGRTHARTDGWTDGRTDNVKTVYPTTNKVCGGYKDPPKRDLYLNNPFRNQMMTSETVGVYVIFGYVARLVSFHNVTGAFAEILSH